jgi:hypothetical protein
LEFPEVGLDDTSTYRGYTTRFFKDSAGNTLQVYINQNNGRVVNLWADAANESMSFTARDAAGRPAVLAWDAPGAEVTSEGKTRYVQYTLSSNSPSLQVGLFVLNTMRIERDFQYLNRHTLAFDAEPFIAEELTRLILNLERLPAAERDRHLSLLQARSPEEIRSRLIPRITSRSQSVVLIEQPTFDDKNRLSLELSVDGNQARINLSKDKLFILSLQNAPVKLAIRVGTDSPALTPLRREDVFNSEFMRFFERAKSEHDRARRSSGASGKDRAGDERLLRFRRLERQAKSMELMSFQEKLMAGMPNYATYFGRDMMMSALMLEPIWSAAMLEHVIACVLRKLNANGEVSHEEALGGQAIRENAGEYNKLIEKYFDKRSPGNNAAADSLLDRTRAILGNLQAVRENYLMVDDDFQLPILVGRYLVNQEVSTERKRNFLMQTTGPGQDKTRVAALLRNLMYVENAAAPYIVKPEATNLVSFPRREDQRWFPGSWRDSNAGYANGRFAMDINAIWVPKALEAIQTILSTLRDLDFVPADLENMLPEMQGTRLSRYVRDPESLQLALSLWREASKHFKIILNPQQIELQVGAKLSWLAEPEKAYWSNILTQTNATRNGIEFLALALAVAGRPIPVANTDAATLLFLENFTEKITRKETTAEEVLKLVEVFIRPYPVGLFVAGLGPLVANDAYAAPAIWESFKRDHYHSPRVVWGREVNLILLGLSKQILAAFDEQGRLKDPRLESYVHELRGALNKIIAAVEASGLKHNELWSYKIVDGKLLPSRYATSTDLQLWNLTDLAVQYFLQHDAISGL